MTFLHEWKLAPAAVTCEREKLHDCPARQRNLTEQAATMAIDTACRPLRLPSMRNEFVEIADRAAKDQMTYHGFLAELLMTECDDRAQRRSEAVEAALRPAFVPLVTMTCGWLRPCHAVGRAALQHASGGRVHRDGVGSLAMSVTLSIRRS